MESSKEFTELIEKINRLKSKNEKSISLKEEAKLENQERQDIERRERDHNNDNKLIDTEHDLFLKEAFNISYDYIKMLKH